jgi:hypothetical protein
MSDKMIEVEGDKPKVARTRKVMAQERAELEREQQADDRSSRILFSVKCLRPTDKYPYETAVFETERSVPVRSSKELIEDTLQAWYKMIEAGIAVGQFLAKEKP